MKYLKSCIVEIVLPLFVVIIDKSCVVVVVVVVVAFDGVSHVRPMCIS
jgi:hypothetical protein